MNSEFEQYQLEKILQNVAKHLSRETNIFLFGGAVMVYSGLKPATKDIDILFDNENDYKNFLKAARTAGFIAISAPLEYKHFDMSTMLRNPETNWRLDLFVNRVCKKFCFNLDARKRSKLFRSIKNLKVFFVSFEDIFLMKSLTRRERDLEDMNTILGFGLNFKEIGREIENQKEHKWDILERIFEFEQKYHIKLSLPAKLRKDYQAYAEEQMKRLLMEQVKAMLKENKSKKEIQKYFSLSEKEWKRLIG